MSNTLKRAAELLRDSAESLFECNTVDGKWESCAAKDDWEELLLVVDDLDRMAQVEPVAYITFKGCLIHASDPKLKEYSSPDPLYAAPQEPVNQQMLAALQKIAGMTMSMYSTQIEAILDAKRVANAAIAAAEDVQAQKGGAPVQSPEHSDDMKNSALLLQAATDICMKTGQPVSDFAKWLSDGGMLDLITAWLESIRAKNSGVAINSEPVNKHIDSELATAADNALRYIASAAGLAMQYAPFSASVSSAMLAGALAKYKTKEGQEADGAIVSSIASAHSIQKGGAV